jgi:single-stranded-DNA-specific exonuclease
LSSHCISHVKDADGLCSAALALAAKGGTFRLTDYDDLIGELGRIPSEATQLVLCDLGTDPSRFPEFKMRIGELVKRLKVTYIDHHYMTAEMKTELESLGIRVVHSVDECASMLTYVTFRGSLPAEYSYLAMFGAVTDYLDSSPLAGKMMERFDRQFVLLESTMLSYAIANQGRDARYLETLVEALSRMQMPHTIQGVSAYALKQAETMRTLEAEVGRKGSVMGKLAYMETDQSSTGNVAKLLLGAFNVQVGVSYRAKQGGRVEVSLRCTSECRIHLGQTISEIAAKHQGNGGGHARAAGCTIPEAEVIQVLRELEARL